LTEDIMKKLLVIAMGFGAAGLAFGKLPPLTEEAKAKAAEAKAKAAWGGKVAAYKLCLVQDKVAAGHVKAKGGDLTKVTPPCQDPGPYVAAAPAATVPDQAASAVPGAQAVKNK
jgi:hypothetical protein